VAPPSHGGSVTDRHIASDAASAAISRMMLQKNLENYLTFHRS
jgi:hypothetical protein